MKYAIVIAVGFLLAPLIPAQILSQDLPGAMTGTGRMVLTGKVATETNSPPLESVSVALECGKSDAIAHAQSDVNGYFSMSVNVSDRVPTLYPSPRDGNVLSASELSACELVANLAGYTSEPLRLTRGGDIGTVDVGTLVLRSIARDQSFTVSVTSLAAPDKAKVAFEKGEEQKKKGKWAAAMESFRKAIAAYPRYALAWLELGRVQAKQSDFVQARESFHESITQDSKLADGYIELAHLAAQQQQWQELKTATEHLLQIHPDVAEYWFLSSAADFNLGNLTQAETCITRGMRLDSGHRVPQMEYLYGLILARKQDYPAAAEHVSAYLKLSPHAADAQNAQKMLGELQKSAQVATR
jgi:tetratricopeptide (TPR) repeat protein